MNPWFEDDIISNGTRLHYYRTGGAKIPLVLVHGITDDGLCWTPVAEALSDQYDIIMVDLRGHGKSEAPEEGYDLKNLATDVGEFVIALDLDRPIILGHSLGAAVTLILAGLMPEVPRAILLEDPPNLSYLSPSTGEEQNPRTNMLASIISHKRKTRADLLAQVQQEHPDWSEVNQALWADSKHRFSLNITQILTPKGGTPLGFLLVMSRISCPGLLITADPQLGAIISDEDAAAMLSVLSKFQRAHIPGAGHSIRREQFDRYIEVVRDFLAGLES